MSKTLETRLTELEQRVDPPQRQSWELVILGEGEDAPEANGDDWAIVIGGHGWKEGSDGELIETT